MKQITLAILSLLIAAQLNATEHSYVWNEVYPNYKSQIPSSDFTTPDGMFRFTSDKAKGVTGPAFDEDSKAGLLYRLYADNTLRIESLKDGKITAITFVIGGNGHYKLAQLTPSSGTMGTPYLGKDPTGTFREYKLFWTGNTADITFTVGHECEYGVDCAEQGKTGEPGTCMTKQIIITSENDALSAINQVNHQSQITIHKLIKDGHLLIQRGDEVFNATGVRVR